MSNQYNVRTQAILVRPSVETAVKLSIYAEQKGITRAMATKRLLDNHPALGSIQLDEEGHRKAEELVRHNIDMRQKKAANPSSDYRFNV